MEKLELNFLSASPLLNSRKQLAQSFSATNSGLFLFALAFPEADPDCYALGHHCWRGSGKFPLDLSAPPRFSACLVKESRHLLNSYCQSCS